MNRSVVLCPSMAMLSETHPCMTKVFRLYDYQTEIMRRLTEAWLKDRSVMVQMPTGTGKTVVLAALVSEECAVKGVVGAECTDGLEHIRPEGASVFIVAHRRELVTQIEETVSRFGIGREDGRVSVMSIQWLTRHAGELTDRPRLVIIDEAHHAVADTYRMLWDIFPDARFLGLTATPCRMNRRGFADLFDTLITSWSIAEFIGKGYLSAFDYVSIRPGSEEQRLIDSLEKHGADGDYQIKEMDGMLNRNASIARLYMSMERFAGGRKGIVYAISIAHARNIAAYYNNKGISTAAIDSRSPAAERQRLVEDFKAGRIQVLVNVDIFSEGFDCPDVEFVQLARPTLSLAKYLQQVGRGLRRTNGKRSCVLIDNVGLYRMFGLPTTAWDWEAMFRGIVSGKGSVRAEENRNSMKYSEFLSEETANDCDMEVIIAHDQLLSEIGRMKESRLMQMNTGELKAWQDTGSGLWGLRYGNRCITDAQFVTVLDIRYGMAAVRFRNADCGIINGDGEIVWKKSDVRQMIFLKYKLLHITVQNKSYYIDIENLRVYKRKPKVQRFGNVELLEIDHTYYSRTKNIYINNQGIDRLLIDWKRFYLAIYDMKTPYSAFHRNSMLSEHHPGFACILENDCDSYYWIFRRLADGSIIIMDNDEKYYHAAEGKSKNYIGCCDSEGECERCRTEIELLTRLTKKKWNMLETKRKEIRRQQLSLSDEAIPFRSGVKWGLRVGNRITVPPIYRRIKSPVGKYCAVEKNYSQWGVVALDGTIMVEPKYSDIEINTQGMVTGIKITGIKEQLRLP